MTHGIRTKTWLVVLLMALVHEAISKEIDTAQDLHEEETLGYELPWGEARSGSRSLSKSHSSSSSKSHGVGEGKGTGFGENKKKPKGHYVVGVPEEEFNRQEAAKKNKQHGSYGYSNPSDEHSYSQGYGSGYSKPYGAQEGGGEGQGHGQGYGKSHTGPYAIKAYIEEEDSDERPYDGYHKRAPVTTDYSPSSESQTEKDGLKSPEYHSYAQPNPELVSFQYPAPELGYTPVHHHHQHGGATGYRTTSSSPKNGHHSEQWFHQEPNYHYQGRSRESGYSAAQGGDQKRYQPRQGQIKQGKGNAQVSIFIKQLGHTKTPSTVSGRHGKEYGAGEGPSSSGKEQTGYLLLPVIPNDDVQAGHKTAQKYEGKQYGANSGYAGRQSRQKATDYLGGLNTKFSYAEDDNEGYNGNQDRYQASKAQTTYKNEQSDYGKSEDYDVGKPEHNYNFDFAGGYGSAQNGQDYGQTSEKAYDGQQEYSHTKDNDQGYQKVASFEPYPEKDAYQSNVGSHETSEEKTQYENGNSYGANDGKGYNIPIPDLKDIELEYGFTPFVGKENGVYGSGSKEGSLDKVKESYQPQDKPVESYHTFNNGGKSQTTHVIHNKPEVANVVVGDVNLDGFDIPLKNIETIIPEKLFKDVTLPHAVPSPGLVQKMPFSHVGNKRVVNHDPYGLSVSYQNVGGFHPLGMSLLNSYGGHTVRYFNYPQEGRKLPAQKPQLRHRSPKTKSIALFMSKSPQFRQNSFRPFPAGGELTKYRSAMANHQGLDGLPFGLHTNYANKDLIPQEYLHGMNFMGTTLIPFTFR